MTLITELSLRGLVLRPDTSTMRGPVVTLEDGTEYAVGPALYRIERDGQRYESVLGPQAAEVGEHITPVYVPVEQWPAGLELDNAVIAESTDVARSS